MGREDLAQLVSEALRRVPDTYEPFHDAMMMDINAEETYQRTFLDWIESHQEASSSDVIEYVETELIPDYFDRPENPDPDWFEGYTDEELERDYGYKNKAEAAADTPGTPEYEARMREEADADDMDDGDEGLTEME